jgi:hypothetical protein
MHSIKGHIVCSDLLLASLKDKKGVTGADEVKQHMLCKVEDYRQLIHNPQSFCQAKLQQSTFLDFIASVELQLVMSYKA